MEYLFSPSKKTFYPATLLSDYKKAGSLPSDVIEVNEAEAQEYQGVTPPTGKVLASDEYGRPAWSDKPAPTQDELNAKKAKVEHAWVESELDAVTIELMYHWTGDPRASHTEQAWKDYAISLRDYTSTDDDGNPVIVGESRPSIEDFI